MALNLLSHGCGGSFLSPQPQPARARREASGEPFAWLQRQVVTWLIPLRWMAVAAVAAAICVGTTLTPRIPPESAPVLWGLNTVLALFTLIVMLMVQRAGISARLIATQICVDVLVLGAAIHIAGGMANPFVGLFVVHAGLAGLLLNRRAAVWASAGIAGFVALLTAAEVTGLLPPGCLFDGRGLCRESDTVMSLAWGGAAAVLALGSGLLVEKLMAELHRRRLEAIAVTAELSDEAARLDAAHAELEEQQVRLQQIVGCMADAVIVAAPDGEILLYNGAAAGLWPHFAQGADDLRVCHSPGRWETMLAALRDPKPGERHPVMEVGDRSYDATFAPVRGSGGETIGAVMIARDITERLEKERLRRDEERMSTIGRLAAALAHELNNPLGAISLFSQHAVTLLEPDSPLHEHLETVRYNAGLCSRIVRDLLTYARQRPPEHQALDPRTLVDDVARTLAPHCRQHRVIVERSFEVDPDLRLWGDPDQLRQVLVNLGLNAVDAMAGGGSLSFAVAAAADGAAISVADSGPGIELEDRERIFTAFYTTKSEGTGLGLAVVRDIVAAHTGTVELDEAPGGGARFTLRLPTVSATREAVA